MSIEEVSPEVYSSIVRNPFHVFGSAQFNDLNKGKAEDVYYLLFKDSKYRLGLIAAKKNHTCVSPFSAPFGGFSFIHEDVRLKAIEEAVVDTEIWCKSKGLDAIRFTLPPPVYHESFLSKVSNILYRNEYVIENMELNFHFDLSKFTADYIQNIWHNARKNLNIALNNNLTFIECHSIKQKETAYQVIQHNRTVRGKPLRMTWEQVEATTALVPAHFFLVLNAEENALAAAIVFIVAPRVAQVVYWGDIPEHQQLKTMNFLSYKVFEFYKQKDFRIVDIGYSTEDSVPNHGLCEFKESLGCDIQPKLTLVKSLNLPG